MPLSNLHLPAINVTGNNMNKTKTLSDLSDFFIVKNSNIHKMQAHNIQNGPFKHLSTTRVTNVSHGEAEDKHPKYKAVSQCCPRTWREQQSVFLSPLTTVRTMLPTTHLKTKRCEDQGDKSLHSDKGLHSANSSRSVPESDIHNKWVKGFRDQYNRQSLHFSSKIRNNTVDLRITGICCPTSWTVPQPINIRDKGRQHFQLRTGKKI